MATIAADLLARYGTAAVPRYTSYPSANLWPPQDDAYARAVLAQAGARPVSLYVHVPFCRKLCLYCGCNMQVAHDQREGDAYLDALALEVERVASAVAGKPPAVQLHLGGGTPTWLDEAQLERMMQILHAHFTFAPGCETSIEVHPAVTSHSQVRTLARLGFNRISMGVQDFDPEVQQRIQRLQSFELTRDLIVCARDSGFQSVNVDLMYGLPMQTQEKFARTLEKVDALAPDRIALFGYAHMPKLKKAHRLFVLDELPDMDERLALLEMCIAHLQGAGFVYIGLDHFARPEDELCRARAEGTLRRNFMGYTTCADSDVLAFGPSAISEVRGAFIQNERDTTPWAERLASGGLTCVRGARPSVDDDRRREVIQHLFCDLALDTRALGERFGCDFEETFAAELQALAPLVRDGLVERGPGFVRVTETGQLLLRNVAAVFDAYLTTPAAPRHHSTAV
jgi:oxygen-independent coproporphyrinogen III oxidase